MKIVTYLEPRIAPLGFLPDRILDLVDVDPDSAHLLWIGGTSDCGYPRVWNGERLVMLARWVLEETAGPAPSRGHQAGHVCHDLQFDPCPDAHTELDFHRLCVEPTHLRWMTARENIMASARSIARINHERAAGRPARVHVPPWHGISDADRETNAIYADI